MARFLGLDATAFADRYMRLLPNRQGLGLAEAADGACVFLEGNACRVYAVRPRQCRDFPAGWTRAEAASACRMAFQAEATRASLLLFGNFRTVSNASRIR